MELMYFILTLCPHFTSTFFQMEHSSRADHSRHQISVKALITALIGAACCLDTAKWFSLFKSLLEHSLERKIPGTVGLLQPVSPAFSVSKECSNREQHAGVEVHNVMPFTLCAVLKRDLTSPVEHYDNSS